MSKFEEEFEKFKLTAGASPKHKKIINHFKDWQPQQALPVVPEFVAEWYEEHKNDLDTSLHFLAKGDMANDYPEMDDWYFIGADSFETIIKMKLFGYTVEKEKRYYLKNKLTTSYLALENKTGYYCHVSPIPASNHWKTSFTQQEIESMQTGSYEQIEVEE